MNRRGFLRALAVAPIAAAVAPLAVARPAFATGGFPKPKRYLVGEIGPELILPGTMTAQKARQLALMRLIADHECARDLRRV